MLAGVVGEELLATRGDMKSRTTLVVRMLMHRTARGGDWILTTQFGPEAVGGL